MRAGEVYRETGQGRAGVKNLDHLGGKVRAGQALGLRPLPPSSRCGFLGSPSPKPSKSSWSYSHANDLAAAHPA